MSVNGAASGRINNKKFCDFDGLKKKELERRKKLRLEQVRTQSKELSMKIRDRVAREKHRQLRNVEEIKRRELLSWKEKHVNNTMADYYYCLSNVGDAHVAAERENELTEQMQVQERENRKIAVLRGRKALQKERLKNPKKNERLVKRKPKTNLFNKNVPNTSLSIPNALKADDNLSSSEDDENQLSESDDGSIADGDIVHGSATRSPSKSLNEQLDEHMNPGSVRFSQVSDLIEERRRARNLCDQLFESASGTSKPEQLSKSTSPRMKSPPGKPMYAPKSLQPKSPQTKALHAPKSPIRTTKSPVRKSPVKESHQFSRVEKASASQRSVVGNLKKATTPNKVMKSKNANVTTTPQRREFVPRFTKPGILKNRMATEPATDAVTPESPEKVQFYDHFSRYRKEYDAVPGMVIRESQPPSMNANEAARVQNEMDEIRFRQLEELRRKSEQRSKESLQKNQVRKDYENLTKELDELCKEENRLRTFAMPAEQFSEDRISQLARNRQQSMNRAFEDIYHKPVVITCPPIGSNEHSSSSDVNVAVVPSPDDKQQQQQQKQPQIDPFDSSDSCTSILLGYVDNRSRKLVKDIKQCKEEADDDKRKKLVTLLTRLDHLRKLLMEEIVRNSSLNLEPFYRSVLEVETEKKEILHDPDANKENTKKRAEQLDKREQSVKSQEMKLERKMRELFRKEQDKAVEARDEHIFESVTSETITSNIDESEPVKILIEVKNGAKIRKSHHHPKKSVTVTQIAANKEYQHKTSVGSTTSTAYRSPPPTFHTEFTNILSKEADAKATKVSTESTAKSKPMQQQTALHHYITRLLGMSQQSVDQLGVSSGSSIATPSDSVIDVPENISTTVIDSNHLNRVQAKINDSLRLSKEVDDSLKQAKKQGEAKKVRDLKEKETKLTKEREVQAKIQMKTHHSDVAAKSTRQTHKTKQKPDSNAVRSQRHEAMIEPNIPENSKRIIADLTKQIEQVRQDKQKMLEKTLTNSSHSSSGKDFDLTEYRDIVPFAPPSKRLADENNCSSQASDVQSSPGHFIDEEQPKNLINTKRIGISFSRDSGIGSSRPVTSTDFRTSPDIKIAEKSTMATQTQTQKVIGADSPIDPSAGLEDTVGKSAEGGGFTRKTAKPPISLKRYSPQLDTEQLQPHDLSTINEVETSAASRFNHSTRNETSESSMPVPYNKFPTFVEYAKMQDIASIEASSDDDKGYSETVKKMLDVTCLSETDLNYRKLDKTHPKDRTTEKSTNNEMESEYIDVAKEIKQRRLMETDDISSSTTSNNSKLLSSTSTSSDFLLAKDFNRIGLNWASAMLKKTSTAQNLESSSSSIKSVSIVGTRPHQPAAASGASSPDDRINGNPLNIRDFLARELLKRSRLSTSSSMSDNSTLTDQFLKSLITISTNSSFQQQVTLRTSTPNRNNNLSSESEQLVAATDIGHTAKDEHLFSGESILSSVRGGISLSDETSGAKETSE